MLSWWAGVPKQETALPCGQNKALGGSCQCLVPHGTSHSTTGPVPGLLAVSEELCCSVLGMGYWRGEQPWEAGVTKSILLGALFTLPYGETVCKNRMGKICVFKNQRQLAVSQSKRKMTGECLNCLFLGIHLRPCNIWSSMAFSSEAQI